MTPLELKQMKASGGINKLAAEHIEYLQKTIDLSNKCMKEKQKARIDDLKAEICGLKDVSEPILLDKKEAHDLLISAANELSDYIAVTNKELESKICPTDLDPPQYHDFQTAHDLVQLANKILRGKR